MVRCSIKMHCLCPARLYFNNRMQEQTIMKVIQVRWMVREPINLKMSTYKKTIGAIFILLASISITHAEEHDGLVLAVHPYLPTTELQRKFTPLTEYLSKEIGVPISLRFAPDYDKHLALIANDKVDLAYLGPAELIRMMSQYGTKKPLLARLEVNGRPFFTGKIVTHSKSGIKSIEDLKNSRFAFGDANSTMSHLVPRFMLQEAGILEQLKKYSFLGSHTNVALGVLLEQYDAGAVKEAVYEKYKHRGLRLVADTPPISEHLFVASEQLPDSVVVKIRDAMLNMMGKPDGLSALKSIKSTATGLVPVAETDYDNLRRMLKVINAK